MGPRMVPSRRWAVPWHRSLVQGAWKSRAVIPSAWPRHCGGALGSRGNEGGVEDGRRRGRMEENCLEFVLDLVVRFPLREEFADNLEHPDPVPLRLLPGGRLALLAQTIQMVNLVNREAPGWTKRLRLGSALPDRSSCASRMSALEQSIQKFAEEPTNSVIKPELGKSFDSLDEAYDFYSLYSWEIGFGIRYGKSRLNAEITKSMQEIACGCNLFNDKFGACLVETTGWSFVHPLVAQHEPCTREDSGVYVMHCILEFTGLYLRSTMNQEQIEQLRKKIAYEIVTIKGNKGDIPEFLYEEILD